ncbi:DUF5344 family protein [Sporolactobacillus sp. Y61]|jgi:hypothetical protein|uniref:DUF5344 family protein n=1 Tax=Sporolactobacillus sp. Y61 TaxID=3160863 RepID=A0AAU8IIL2_9BACL|nr:DUF5344 family protein [Sporolactobacillus sp. THM19-2]RYL87265.1 hypothetical protein EWH91_13150 [Sporolactobacillus sp. THM19-2]
MYKIELNDSVVKSRIDQAEQALSRLMPPGSFSCGSNRLAATGAWREREQMLVRLLSAYLAGVQKNISDTRANVDLLKRQDEVIR